MPRRIGVFQGLGWAGEVARSGMERPWLPGKGAFLGFSRPEGRKGIFPIGLAFPAGCPRSGKRFFSGCSRPKRPEKGTYFLLACFPRLQEICTLLGPFTARRTRKGYIFLTCLAFPISVEKIFLYGQNARKGHKFPTGLAFFVQSPEREICTLPGFYSQKGP